MRSRTLAVRGAPAIGIAGAYGLVIGLDEAGTDLAAQPLEPARPTRSERSAPSARRRSTSRALSVRGARRAAAHRVAPARFAPPSSTRRSGCTPRTRPPATRSGERRRRARHAASDPHPLQHGPPRDRRQRHRPRGDLRAPGPRGAAAGSRDRGSTRAPGRAPDRVGADALRRRHPPDPRRRRRLRDGPGMVDAVIVGCDRVAANGDTANKIGTYQLAVLANRHGIPFYVAGPRLLLRCRHTDGRRDRCRGARPRRGPPVPGRRSRHRPTSASGTLPSTSRPPTWSQPSSPRSVFFGPHSVRRSALRSRWRARRPKPSGLERREQ